MPTPQQKAQAVEMAAAGHFQYEIAEKIGITPLTLWRWRQSDPVFEETFSRAQEAGSMVQAEKMIETARNEPDVRRAAEINKATSFILERKYRKLWSPSMDMTVSQTVDIAGALIEAKRRVLLPGSDLARIPGEQTLLPSTVYDVSPTDTQSVSPDDGPEIDPFS